MACRIETVDEGRKHEVLKVRDREDQGWADELRDKRHGMTKNRLV